MVGKNQTVGILALQGCVAPHQVMLEKIGTKSILVRLPEDLENIDRLIIPGGESTTMLKLAKQFGLWEKLVAFDRPMWGICAGAILLAKEVVNPAQESLGKIALRAERNAYGRQLDSFMVKPDKVFIEALSRSDEYVFIRAPKLKPLEANCRVLAELKSEAVLLQQGNVLVSAFHPELGISPWCHEYFLGI